MIIIVLLLSFLCIIKAETISTYNLFRPVIRIKFVNEDKYCSVYPNTYLPISVIGLYDSSLIKTNI